MQVHRVFSKGAASLEGSIQRGDSILSINGTSLEGKTHGEVVSCLHQAKPSGQAVVVIWRNTNEDANMAERQLAARHAVSCPDRECGAPGRELGIFDTHLSAWSTNQDMIDSASFVVIRYGKHFRIRCYHDQVPLRRVWGSSQEHFENEGLS